MGKLSGIKITTPTYTEKLPSNGKKINFTPFRVGDEKTLLIASQSKNPIEMLNALKSIVDNCVDYPVADMEPYDIEYMFLKLRAKSVGETSEIGVACNECKTYNKITVDLEAVVVEKPEKHTNMIKISDSLAFEMKQADAEVEAGINRNDPEDLIRLVCLSIKRVYSGEDVLDIEPTDYEELKEIVESLTTPQFEKIQEFFRTIPKLSKKIEFECGSCGHQNKQVLEGLSSFF